jgi:CheY-like chemotaxis protein
MPAIHEQYRAPMHTTSLPSDSREASHQTASHAEGDSAREIAPTRILVVDDEPLIADTIVQILNRSGFIAEAAYGGREAIDAARRINPELILSDVLMPHIDGVEAAIAIQKFLPETRIVLFSGQAATVEILARARKRGYHFELLAKPLHPTQLIKHLRQN